MRYRHQIVFALTVFLVQACSVIFPTIAPFSDLPPPTGPFTVGTRSTTWTDSSRDEPFSKELDFRRLVVQVWYPVAGNVNGTPTRYVDDSQLRMAALARQLRLPVFPIEHFTEVLTNSYRDAVPEQSQGTYPVLIFSHGLSGMRFQNSALMEELASHGYIVVAPDHPYEANITIFPDGSTALYAGGKRRSVLRGEASSHIDFSQLSIIVDDLKFLIDKVQGQQSNSILVDLPTDKGKIGVIGHSLGGAAVINTAFEDDRVDAIMVLDGWYLPLPDSVLVKGVRQPYMHLGQKEWRDTRNYKRMDMMVEDRDHPFFKLLVSQTKHPDYTDMPLFSPFSRYIRYTGTRKPFHLNRFIRDSSLLFFNAYLKAQDPALIIDSLEKHKTQIEYTIFSRIPDKKKPHQP